MEYINETIEIEKKKKHVCIFLEIAEGVEQCVVCKKIRKIRK